MNTRTKIKDLSRGNQAPPQEELNEVELRLVSGGRMSTKLNGCTAPNTCDPCGEDDC